jgi:hypothetical protein
MNNAEMLAWIGNEGLNNSGVQLEYPTVCGQVKADTGRGRCKGHGHMNLAVAPETAQQVMDGIIRNKRPVMILITLTPEVAEKLREAKKQ